jgi:hypothetical protein
MNRRLISKLIGAADTLRTARREFVQFHLWTTDLSPIQGVQIYLSFHPTSYLVFIDGYFPRVKASETWIWPLTFNTHEVRIVEIMIVEM